MKIISHLDMDAFFAAVEERENPQFKGWGIVVGADPKNGLGRGVVSTANYQARKYGIHSAMPISTAWRLSQTALKSGEPKTVFLPVNMGYYAKVSGKIMDIIHKYVHLVEQTSIDEAYLDLTFCAETPAGGPSEGSQSELHLASVNKDYGARRLNYAMQLKVATGIREGQDPQFIAFDNAVDLIQNIKSEIKLREKLTAKVGVGPNKLISKMASAACKPDGLTVVRPDEVENFLSPLPIGDIPGIGPKSEEFFHKKKIFTVSQLRQMRKEQLTSWLGKHGEDIYGKVRGIDDSPVSEEREIKSISEQETFEIDTLSGAFILGKLDKLAGKVLERMRGEVIERFKTVTIVVRFSDFTTISRTHTLSDYTDNLMLFKNESMKMILPFLDRRGNPQLKKIRLIGIGIENFGGEKEKRIIAQQLF